MPATLLPGANVTAQWFGGTYNTAMPYVEKVCLHTTEGAGWPAYSGGSNAPHLSWLYLPGSGRQVRQHFRFNQIARALRNEAGGVQTNSDGVIQIELIGTCDPKYAAGSKGLYWPAAPDAALELLAADLAWLCSEFYIPRTFAPTWLPYPSSYGASKARMSGATFNAFRGILGHMHVVENLHGDPGALNVARIRQLMPATQAGGYIPNVTPVTPEDDVSIEDVVTGLLQSIDPKGTPSFAAMLGDLIYQRTADALVDATDATKTPSFLEGLRSVIRTEVAAALLNTDLVDEDALGAVIVAALPAQVDTVVAGLSDADLPRIAKATADEIARRGAA